VHKDGKESDDDERRRDVKPPRIEIDFAGIGGRILGFPVEEGKYEQIVATRRRALFTQFPLRGIKPEGNSWSDDEDEPGTLLAYDFEQQRLAPLAVDVHDIRLGGDGRTLVYASHERMRVIDALVELPEEGQEEPKLSTRPAQRLARPRTRERRGGTARRVAANVRGSVAHAARAVLGRIDVGRRLGSRARALRPARAAGAHAHRVVGRALGNVRRIGHVARL
jgi:hypothetical protein